MKEKMKKMKGVIPWDIPCSGCIWSSSYDKECLQGLTSQPHRQSCRMPCICQEFQWKTWLFIFPSFIECTFFVFFIPFGDVWGTKRRWTRMHTSDKRELNKVLGMSEQKSDLYEHVGFYCKWLTSDYRPWKCEAKMEKLFVICGYDPSEWREKRLVGL